MVVLRVAKEAEFSDIVDWVNEHDSDFMVQWAGLTYQYPLTVEQMKEHYRSGINTIETGVFLYMIQEDSLSDDVVGTIQIARINMETREAVIGRFMMKSEKLRGHGTGRAALEEAVRIGFEELGLERIKLNVFDINERAIRCYKSVGFKEGTIRINVYTSTKGIVWNNIEMTMDKDFWKQNRGMY
ncbi:GNAT family N-acetyltransferase [Paenibacillus segetis]|uniref:Acetyltransferase n=1 Tax=Paenibacillus segetis TaxID=1325360 RepID=A0ABQ1YID7_9BACL|nr:GNAT family protein [Paenibacillus segetis]GGH27409.1 acetyltransferase [Paenibacillus segetis]